MSKLPAYKDRRYVKGLCTWCSGPRDDERVLCSQCRQRQSDATKVIRAARQANSQCKKCGEDVSKNSAGLLCVRCWFLNIASVSLRSASQAGALQELFQEQGGKCAYSQEELIPAVNATVDHKTPLCRGGSNAISNIQWVTRDINRIKGKMTHEEFVDLARRIVSKHGL